MTAPPLDVLCALRIEAVAARRGDHDAKVHAVGMGKERAVAFAAELSERAPGAGPVAVVGVAGGLAPGARPGDVVVADRVVSTDGTVDRELSDSGAVRDELVRAGLAAVSGLLVSSPVIVRDAARTELAATGALAVDMETAWLADAALAAGRSFVAVRIVLDTPTAELFTPRTLRHGPTVLARLGPVVDVLATWARHR